MVWENFRVRVIFFFDVYLSICVFLGVVSRVVFNKVCGFIWRVSFVCFYFCRGVLIIG